MTLRKILAAKCEACSADLHEGRSAYYDDYRDKHFCDKHCYSDWWTENSETLAKEYFALNVEKVDL